MDQPTWTVQELRAAALKERGEKQKELTEEQVKQNERLLRAHNAFVEAVAAKVREGVETAFKHNPYADHTKIFNPHEDADLEDLKWMTVLRGYYNKEKKRYYRNRHLAAGIKADPLVELKRKLKDNGVTDIIDVSDPAKGFNLVLRVEFGSDIEL